MNLGEWLWKNQKKQLQFSKELKISNRSVEQYIKGKGSSGLLTAIKIHFTTDEKVSFIDLLSTDDMIKLESYLKKMKKIEKYQEKISNILETIEKSRKSREKVEEDE
jgi:predicted transcriptional regulator